MSTFNYADALEFDNQLTGEERTVRDQAKSYCAKKLYPRLIQAFRNESNPFLWILGVSDL